MKRRAFLQKVSLATTGLAWPAGALFSAETNYESSDKTQAKLDPALAKDWLARWEKNILGDERNRYCDHDDLEGIVAAFEHGLVFSQADIQRLIATNRDFMWNQQLEGAKFQRLDGGQPDARWKNSPGVLWTALVPYDDTLRKILLANHDPASWGGLAITPWFLGINI
jgi:hypothetical protein